MKSTLICESGIIGEDGKLRCPQDRLGMFYLDHKGERALIKIEAIERHASQAMFRYYFGYVLPTLRQAFARTGRLLTEKQTHAFMWETYPGEHRIEQDIRETPRSQVAGFLAWLKWYAAEWLDTYIEDPKSI